MRKRNWIFLFLALLNVPTARSQATHDYCVMFYNVENLFHPSNDTIIGDDEFTPEGIRGWGFYRYHKKIAAVCKVLLAVNGWDMPDIVCLSEIENQQVLKDILYHPLLMGKQYQLLHRDSPDHRGMDVGILYRCDRIQCIDTCWLPVADKNGALINTRDILVARFLSGTLRDTIMILGNHWTSRYGGALETEEKRILQAGILGKYVDSVCKSEPGLVVIAGGDLNDPSDALSIQHLTTTSGLQEIFPGASLTVPGADPRASDILNRRKGLAGKTAKFLSPASPHSAGTYKYQGNWESIDHVFIGGNIQQANCRARIFSHPMLLEDDLTHTGKKPFRTYSGYRYHGGISDHLPLVLEVTLPGNQ